MAADPLTTDAIDDLLNYDVSDDDPFADNPLSNTRDDKTTLSPRAAKRKVDDDADKENFGLGLDEEVKITKKRKPTVKLDETRLLSHQGIPRLRELGRSGNFRKKLHVKGKGHEFADVARLLNYYQLWLDNLFPRAKFADGLQMIEKVGHSKRMTVMRKEWIDEGKPGYARDKTLKKSLFAEDLAPNEDVEQVAIRDTVDNGANAEGVDTTRSSLFGQGLETDSMFFPDANSAGEDRDHNEPDEDELDTLLAQHNTSTARQAKAVNATDSEGEDDLDALLAATEPRKSQRLAPVISDDEDDLDALLAEREAVSDPPTTKQNPRIFDDNNDDDGEEDLDRLLSERQSYKEPLAEPSLPEPTAPRMRTPSKPYAETPSPEKGDKLFTSSPLLNEVDELDAILEEHEAQKERELPRILVMATRDPQAEDSNGRNLDTQDSNIEDLDAMLSSSPLPNGDSFEDSAAKDVSQSVDDEDLIGSSPLPNDEEE